MLFHKLIRPNENSKSRLHDGKGTLVSFDRAIFNGPKALVSYLNFKIFGSRPKRPWISYDAEKIIAAFLASTRCAVLEFGSGMSTLWFAQRAETVCSVEHDKNWYDILSTKLSAANHYPAKIDYQYRSDMLTYANFRSNENERFDVLLVDGPWRAECLRHHMHLVRNGGLIYLDNTDAESSSGEAGELDQAIQLLLDFAKSRDAKVTWFTDFVPTCLFVSQGLMVELPK